MPNEGYRKRLEEWENTQRRMKDAEKSETPYSSGKMKIRAPLGCLIAAGLFALGVIYWLGALAGFWKRWLF